MLRWVAAGIALTWGAAVALTVAPALISGADYSAYRAAYFPFLIVWAGLCVGLVVVARRVGRLVLRAHHALTLLGVSTLLFYGVGRPIELAMLRPHAPVAGASFNLIEEIVVPLAVGFGSYAAFVVLWRLALVRGKRRDASLVSLTEDCWTPAVVFFAIGLLLWADSALAWVIVDFFGGWDPVVSAPWVRFVSEADPANWFWSVAAWPAAVVVCCG